MMRAHRLLLVFLCCTLPAFPARGSDERSIENLRAFAKLYGYVKYFHPSDEAAAVDWNRLAIHGAARVKPARDAEELRSRLRESFGPLAPTLQIYGPGDTPRDVLEMFPKDTSGLQVVAWQHRGDGLDGVMAAGNIYTSLRTHRPNRSGESGAGEIAQGLPAETCKGKEVRLRARLRIEKAGPQDEGRLYLGTWTSGRQRAPEDLKTRTFDAKDWTQVEVVAKVGEDSSYLIVGCALSGTGRLWADDFEVSVLDETGQWKPLDLVNEGFEEGTPEEGLSGWNFDGDGYRAILDSQTPASGKFSVTLGYSGTLFEQVPAIGEAIDEEIAPSLRCRLPVALYTDGKTTLPAGDAAALKALQADLDKVPLETLKADDEALRLGGVIISWNVLQHFYPYFDVVDTDWDAALTEALRGALADRTEKDFLGTLRRMLARLQDGHARVNHPMMKGWSGLPLALDLVEGRIVVAATGDPEKIQVGDLVLAIDGVPALQIQREQEDLTSGTPQWRRLSALWQLTFGDEGTTAKVRLQRGDAVVEVESKRGRVGPQGMTSRHKHQQIEKLEEGIYYVNLARATMAEIDARIDELAGARGIVFDLRGYPNGNDRVIRHMIDGPVQSARWNVPLITYPDHRRVEGYDTSGRWTLQPKAPRLRGKLVFLTDGRAISYAESVMGIIEAYRLAEIVGETTAGTNGNVNSIDLPGGFSLRYTGMKVLKHDGSQHHLVGIRPTVPVERTLKGVLEGRDEFLEKALEIIRR